MASGRRPLLVANWKMNKTVAESLAFVREWARRAAPPPNAGAVELVVCPTVLALWPVARVLQPLSVAVGAQNVELGREGAVTGGVSAYLLAEAQARYVIVGHSERRRVFGEDDALVAAKALSVVSAGLCAIVCVGEALQERDQGRTRAVVEGQLEAVLAALPAAPAQLVIAYEPIWAIGTGRTPTPAEANEVAGWLRRRVVAQWQDPGAAVRVLYGGSVSADNVATFLAESEIDGALVGGASLQLDQWLAMTAAVPPVPNT